MSASMNVSLVPASHDISVQMISSLLGNGWWKFVAGTAPSGPGSILGQLFSVIDIALLMYVSAIMMYTAVVGGLATAHEGVPLGKRYHSVWAPIRGPATWFMLFPLPWAKGLAMIQVILLVAVYWGIGVADDVWSTFVQEVPKYNGLLLPYQGSVNKQIKFIENALVTTAMQEEIVKNGQQRYDFGVHWVGDSNSGQWVWGLTPQNNNHASGIQYSLGTIQVKCSSSMKVNGMSLPNLKPSSLWNSVTNAIDGYVASGLGQLTSQQVAVANGLAQNGPVCQQEEAAMLQAMTPIAGGTNGLLKIGQQIVSMNAQQNGAPPSDAELNGVVQTYVQNESAVDAIINKEFSTKNASALKTFSTEASNLGWASSAFYWWTLENINQQAQSQFQDAQATVTMPNVDAVSRHVGAFYLPYLKAIEGYMYRYNRHLDAQKIQEQQAQSVAYIGGAPSTAGVSWAGKRLEQLPGAFTSGDPLANVAAFGDMMKDAGEDALIAGTAVKVVSSVGLPSGGGATAELGDGSGAGGAAMKAVGGVGTFLVGGVLGAMKALGDLAFPVGLTLIAEGAVLEYVFPAVPGVIMMIAIVGWLFLVVELVVASVLWAAAHVYAEGEGFAPPQASYGYSAAIGIIARPLLLTVGFIFAFFIMDIGGWFVGEALQICLGGMTGYHVGLIGFISIMAVIITTVFLFIKTVLKLITHLADRAPQWIGGHSGQGLGEADIATGAVEASKGKTKEYGLYAGGKVADVANGMIAGMSAGKGETDAGGGEVSGKRPPAEAAGLNSGKAAGQDVGETKPEVDKGGNKL